MINWATLSAPDYEGLSFAAIKQYEDFEEEAYLDTDDIPTIGIGFNLRVPAVRQEVLEAFGLTAGTQDFDDLDDLIDDVVDQSWGSNAALQNALDDALEEYNETHDDIRTSFELTQAEADAIFEVLVAGYETTLSNRIANVPISYERVALISLEYNNGNELIGPGLTTAINAGDRAEAWFEIRYNSNGDELNGIAKRRYVESHIFGLYDDKDPDGAYRPSEADALKTFRMRTKHEDKIDDYETSYSGQISNAQSDLTAIESAAGLGDIGDIYGINQSFELARRKLIDSYADLTQIAEELVDGLDTTSYSGHLSELNPTDLKTSVSISSEATLATQLSGASLRYVWVAASSSAGGTEVAAHTVDRSSATSANDLIFGSITEQGESKNQADTLKGGAGDDLIIGGLGADSIDGGGDEDTVSYLESTEAVQVDFGDAGAETGGFAQGDVLSNIENVLGSGFSDKIAGGQGANIIFGADGNDTLVGDGAGLNGTTAGNDTLIGGDGVDTADYSSEDGSVNSTVTFTDGGVNGDGDQVINVTDTYGKADTLISIEYLILNNEGDTVDLSTFTGSIGIDGGGGDDGLTGGSGNDSLFGGEGVDTVTGGAGDDVLGNIHAPGFDYTALTSTEIDAILASEDGGEVTILDGGDGDDVYLIDYSSEIEGVTPLQQNGAVSFDIRDTDAGTKIYVRDIATGAVDVIGGTLMSKTFVQPGGVWKLIDDNIVFDTCIIPDSSYTVFYFQGASGAVYFVGGEEFYGGGPPCEPGYEPPHPHVPFDPSVTPLSIIRFNSLAEAIEADFSPEIYDSIAGGMTLRIRSTDVGNGQLMLSDLVAGDYTELGLSAPGQSDEPSVSDGVSVSATMGGFSIMGTSSNDFVAASSGVQVADLQGGDDVAFTGDGGDSLSGGDGDDSLSSGDGADVLNGDGGSDTLSGGEGADTLFGGASSDALIGDAGDDLLNGGSGMDILKGGSGFDSLYGGAQADFLVGGGDADQLYGDSGDDDLSGEGGDDTLIGGVGADTLDGGAGNDTADYSASSAGIGVQLNTGLATGGDASGDDYFSIESVIGTAYADGIAGDDGANQLSGIGGNDELVGRDGADTLSGGAGHDTIYGGSGADSLSAGTGFDYVSGAAGNDIIDGGGGNDELAGGVQNDSITGGDGLDTIYGSDGDDTLYGGDHADIISGASNNDIIDGGGGNDTLFGGGQNDLVTGGSGNDVFLYNAGNDLDIIADFVAGASTDDVIELSGLGAAFNTFAEVIGVASDDGTDTTINFGNGDVIVLEGVLVSQLHQNDFVFA